MEYDQPLLEATLIKRYKRFFADAFLDDGSQVTAHCPNTGSMQTCGAEGDKIYLSHNPSPKRKLAYTWELTKSKKGFICVNTHKANHIVSEGIKAQKVKELLPFETLRKEVKIGSSRIDIKLESQDQKDTWVEVKSVTLLRNNQYQFPDAKTQRGVKHLEELARLAQQGDRAVLFLLVNREDGDSFSIADDIDPDYAQAAKKAMQQGVEFLVYRSSISLKKIELGEPVPFNLD